MWSNWVWQKNRTSRLTEIWGIPCSAPKRRDVRDTTTPLAHGTDPLRSTTKKTLQTILLTASKYNSVQGWLSKVSFR